VRHSTLNDRLEALIAPPLEAMGYALIRIQLSGSKHQTLQVMAERRDGRGMTVDDCAEISHTLSALLDVEDPISGSYALEVSSPGIDRPLVRLDDFDRFAGHQAKVELHVAHEGRKRFRGRLLGTDGDTIRVETEEGTVDLPFADIARAKLVLTDELIAASLQPHNE